VGQRDVAYRRVTKDSQMYVPPMPDEHERHRLTSEMLVRSVAGVSADASTLNVGFQAYGLAEYASIERVPQYFGGHRSFFQCPRCSRRCRFLYGEPFLAATGWKCRKCWDLAYASQRQRRQARDWARAARLSEDLVDPSAPQALVRRKGMHSSTFRKRLQRIRELESRALLPVLQRLMGDAQ
jgi:hypothetical protein